MSDPLRLLAPAKVNLALHVTGRRADGYHLLDSLVAFADAGDWLEVSLPDAPGLTVSGQSTSGQSTSGQSTPGQSTPGQSTSVLTVSGPEAGGVPLDGSNSILKAAALAGIAVRVHLEKNLPSAAGIGGGSSDAATVLRAIHQLTGQPLLTQSERLGADVPVCLLGRAARMQGIGEQLTPVALPPLPAVLVNPRREVSTPAVFRSLARTDNPPLPDLAWLTRAADGANASAGAGNGVNSGAGGVNGAASSLPTRTGTAAISHSGEVANASVHAGNSVSASAGNGADAGAVIRALAGMRNDLEPAARALEPVIDQVLAALASHSETRLARMSGSGATCFGLYDSRGAAMRAARHISAQHPGWWVCATVLS